MVTRGTISPKIYTENPVCDHCIAGCIPFIVKGVMLFQKDQSAVEKYVPHSDTASLFLI